MGLGTTGGCPALPDEGYLSRLEHPTYMDGTESLVHTNTCFSFSNTCPFEAVAPPLDPINQLTHSLNPNSHAEHFPTGAHYQQLSQTAGGEYPYQPLSQLDSSSWLGLTLAEAPSDWDWSTGDWQLGAPSIQQLNKNPECSAATVYAWSQTLPSGDHSFPNLVQLESHPEPDVVDGPKSADPSNRSRASSSLDSLESNRMDRDQSLGHGNISGRRRAAKHEKRYHCDVPGCDEMFTQSRSLRRHTRTIHSKARTIFCHHVECEFARIGFNRKDSFLKHYRRRHGGDNDPPN